MVIELTALMRRTWRELNDPATPAKFPDQVTPREPMLSLREVEMRVPIKVVESR
jgi:hypothetical protein